MPRSRATRSSTAQRLALLDEQVRAEHRGEPAEALQALAVVAGVRDDEHVELAAEPLGGARRATDHALVAGVERDQGEQALGDRRLVRTAHLDGLGHLPQRHLPQRAQVLHPEEAVQRRGNAPGSYTLPSLRRVTRSSGGRSIRTISSAFSSSSSGTVSRTLTPVSSAT